MTKQVLDRIVECSDEIGSFGPVSETLGSLADPAATLLRQSGVARILQPQEYGGFETHPRDFAEAVIDIARLDGSTGWIAGTVGLPPWELSTAPRRVRDEVWESDSDVWVASAYQAAGALWPIDDGYCLAGQWEFVSGIDHCEWVLLGARRADKPSRRVAHALVPRADVRIVDDSWDVVGLNGTGSKDVVVTDAYVPAYRVLDHDDLEDGTAARRAGLGNPSYHLPFSTVFPLGITAAVIGMAEGALAHYHAYQLDRDDAVENAAAEIRASRHALLDTVSEFFHLVLDGHPIDRAARVRSRRDQTQAAWRAVRGLDEIVAQSGLDGLRSDSPLQRFWRDAHMGLAHAVHTRRNMARCSGHIKAEHLGLAD